LLVVALTLPLAALALASLATADSVDPSAPATLVVGRPLGPAPGDRVDPGRLGRAHTALPARGRELWRGELAGGLDLPPVIGSAGDLVAALVSPEVVKISGAAGHELWRRRLGSVAAVVAPVLASDGSVVVLCGDGSLWRIGNEGRVRHHVELGSPSKAAQAAPLADDRGGVTVATEHELVAVAADGTVTARALTNELTVGGLIRRGGELLATGADGTVFSWRPPGQVRSLGTLGGAPAGGAALAGPRTLVAVVERDRLVSFDLVTATVTVIASGPPGQPQLEGPPSLTPNGELLVTTSGGELLGFDAHGEQVRLVGLEAVPTPFGGDAGALLPVFRRVELQPSPPLVVDPAGRVGFIRYSGRMGVVERDDQVEILDPRSCARPLALLPAGPGRVVVACRSGSLILWGEQ
jgi:outer membrane protein assembly factor BamB